MSTHKTPKTTASAINFEKSLETLNGIIEKMESGALSLDESLKYFEEGIVLIRGCQKTLTEAEQKVQILSGKAVNEFSNSPRIQEFPSLGDLE